MQTQKTTGSGTKADSEPNPFQTPVKKKAPGANTSIMSNQFLTPVTCKNENSKPKTIEPKTEDEFIKRIFSPGNINNGKNLRYDNSSYLKAHQNELSVKRRFICFDANIDVDYPFLRYSIDQLKELLDGASNVSETTDSKNEQSQYFEESCKNIQASSVKKSSTAEKKLSSPFDGKTAVYFRFVIGSSIEKQILFSLGHDDSVMSHGQLAAKKETMPVSCKAAGILCFEKKNEKWLIKSVSNKTGHFKCGVESFLTTFGMLFTSFSGYLNEHITLINESLESPVDKKPFTFKVNTLKKQYEDCIASAPPAILQVDMCNIENNTATNEVNSYLFFSTPRKQKTNASSSSARDTELVQLVQYIDDTQVDQPVFKLH